MTQVGSKDLKIIFFSYRIYESLPRKVPSLKMKQKKKGANRMSLIKPMNEKAKKEFKNSIFRNQRKRYSNVKGIVSIF